MTRLVTRSAKETKALAKTILADAPLPLVIALYGNLGSGKTTFTQGIAEELGIKARVNSPTFLVHKSYRTNDKKILMLHHFDLYRLGKTADVRSIGLTDILKEPGAIIVIEWPEVAIDILPAKRINIYFEHKSDTEREINIDNTV